MGTRDLRDGVGTNATSFIRVPFLRESIQLQCERVTEVIFG